MRILSVLNTSCELPPMKSRGKVTIDAVIKVYAVIVKVLYFLRSSLPKILYSA